MKDALDEKYGTILHVVNHALVAACLHPSFHELPFCEENERKQLWDGCWDRIEADCLFLECPAILNGIEFITNIKFINT